MTENAKGRTRIMLPSSARGFRIQHRYFRFFGAMAACAWVLLTFPASVEGAAAAKDPFSALRVRRVAKPVSIGNLVLQGTDGNPIRLSDYRGRVVLVEFFMTY